MENDYLLEMKHITKVFPGVKALDDMDFNLKRGEVHVLIGENGAGKSTLMKILAGAYSPDGGELFIEGKKVTRFNPIAAKKNGIGIIYQEFNMVPYLNVAENIYIDHMPKKLGLFVDKKKMHKDARKLLAGMKMNVDTHAPANSITTAQQQMVEVAKALTHNLKILIMDEPTASLSDVEIEQLFAIVRSLTAQGIGIIYISHRLQEIPIIGDRITILRDGKFIATRGVNEIATDEMVKLMVGREIADLYKRERQVPGEIALKVEHLYAEKEKLEDISLEMRRGEIIGLAGLVGAGRTELARTLFHVDPYECGKIYLLGKEVDKKLTPHQVIESGLSLLPEDRKRQGLSLILSVAQNIVMASMDKLEPYGWIRAKAENQFVDRYIKDINIVTPSREQLARNLSGGNQQKVVLAKWLATKADVIIFDEPTRGIDVGAKGEIYALMNELVKEGKAILMISSELPEIIGMSDRIYVMRNRRIVKELSAGEATQELIISYAMEGAMAEERQDG
ncbi:MAG: sugar ABC transporter ATP-binding protein [Candidatus Pelethousia sp.]|nr:sugar ABC transporter ATP-binding protein [Candidatus Pelethousia sp.]